MLLLLFVQVYIGEEKKCIKARSRKASVSLPMR